MRLRLLLGVVAGAVLVVAVAAIAGRLGDDSSPEAGARYAGSEPPPGIRLPELALRSHDGRVVRTDDLLGRAVVLTFLDSQCEDSCPVIAWTVARALEALGPAERADVIAVAITTDPAEDTPESVSRFLERNRARDGLLYLGGGQAERLLRDVWRRFSILSSLETGEDSLHSAPVRVYDRSGTWVSTLHAGADLTAASLAHDVRAALER